MDYYCAFFFYIILWLHLLYIIYLYDQNWQLARGTNMSLSPFPLCQSSWNRLISPKVAKSPKANSHETKKNDNTYTTRQHWKKKKKKTSNNQPFNTPPTPHFPTYPANPLLSLPVIIARNFWVSSLLLIKFVSPFSLNLDLILLFSFRLV